jgi:DNA repair exonuclease SbcCD nuclease subunit
VIVLTADWHVGLRSYRQKEGVDSRYWDIRERLKFLGSYIAKNEIESLVVAGDVFERTHPSPLDYYIVMSFLKKITSEGVGVVIVAGNHDVSSYTNALKPLTKIDYVTVVSDEVFLKRKFDIDFLFIPHGAEIKKEWKCDVLITHADPGYYEEESIRHFPIDGVKYEIAFAGHIHKHSFKDAYNVVTIGALTPRTFGEVKDKQGFVTFDINEESFKYSFVECKAGIKYGDVEIEEVKVYKNYEKEIKKCDEVKLKIHSSNIAVVQEIVEWAEGMGVVVGKWESVKERIVKGGKTTSSKKASVFNFLNYRQALEQWVEANDQPKVLLSLGGRIIDEVVEGRK